MRHWNLRVGPAAAATVLFLSACGDGEETEAVDANLTSAEAGVAGADGPDAVIFYPVGTAASLEPSAMRGEVERIQREQTSGSGEASAGQTSNQMSQATSGAQSSSAQVGEESPAQRGGGTSGASAGVTDFASVDRDGDGRLSPAEYAIHALPSETPARQGATNDENPPYVSDEALNEVATTFRSLDSNGDFFLSDAEFRPSSR